MSRIAETFARLRSRRRRALIPFVVAGDPSLDGTLQIVRVLAAAGADLIELGVPFSDPIADGPINQRASQRALANGVTLGGVLALARRIRGEINLPLVLLSYYNPVFQYGLARFCPDAVDAGVDGVVIPDLPPDESDELQAAARPAGLDIICLIAPTSTDERVRLVASKATGFIYCVSLTGVTGIRDRLSEDVEGVVRRIKAATPVPVCVGFGVSTPEQARQVAEVADGVIVGSALVSLLESDGTPARLGRFVGELRRAIDGTGVREGNPS